MEISVIKGEGGCPTLMTNAIKNVYVHFFRTSINQDHIVVKCMINIIKPGSNLSFPQRTENLSANWELEINQVLDTK